VAGESTRGNANGAARPPVSGVARPSASGVARAMQAWTIARLEIRRVLFARRGLWVYGLALLPALAFVGHGIDVMSDRARYGRGGLTEPALMNTVQQGETVESVIARLGKPGSDRASVGTRRVRPSTGNSGTTTHVIEPAVDARFVRLNITRPTYRGDRVARIYEFEVYGPDGRQNLAVGRAATGSRPCTPDQGPDKAVNGSVSGGEADRWCAEAWSSYLQVDLGVPRRVQRFVVKHGSAGGEDPELDTRDFNIQVSADGKAFGTVAASAGAALIDQRTEYRSLTYFDGRRLARLQFADGTLASQNVQPLVDFTEDRLIFAGIFQYFYLRLAVFFGCLGMFMYLFTGEMANRTLHYWFLAPARREVLLVGKYAAGLVASSVIFGGGALLAFGAMIWPQDAVELQAYWESGGLSHAFWYAAAAALGCLGYGSVFLALGVWTSKPIIPAAIILAWESVNGILPHALQKLSILYYLQSICPVPAPMDDDAPLLIQLLAAPAAPASRPVAILGLLALTAVVLWFASRAVRRMEISYGAEG
jgi:hypothetical protein